MARERIRFLVFFTFLLLVISLACGQSTPTRISPSSPVIEAGDVTRSLTFDGKERSYLLHIPPGIDPDHATPVVLIFHGFGLSGEEMVRISGFNEQADAEGFFAVYPEGSGSTPAWNGGDCCGEAALKQVDDVGFVHALLEDLSTLIDVDPKRVYATGFSNGAIMAYRLACELSEQIAAIAPVSATQALQDCQPGRPVSIQHFHGTADRLNPYDGGYGPGGSVNFASVKDTIQFWVTQDMCPPQAQRSESGNIVTELYTPCDQGAEVELYTIMDGEHAWPGGESVGEGIGQPTSEISATKLMWEFFTDHPMP